MLTGQRKKEKKKKKNGSIYRVTAQLKNKLSNVLRNFANAPRQTKYAKFPNQLKTKNV